MTLRYWSRPASADRVAADALADITTGALPHLLRSAYRESMTLPPSRTGEVATFLHSNLRRWQTQLDHLNEQDAAVSLDFVRRSARWLRDAATSNDPVTCTSGEGPFEIAPTSEQGPGPHPTATADLPAYNDLSADEISANAPPIRYVDDPLTHQPPLLDQPPPANTSQPSEMEPPPL